MIYINVYIFYLLYQIIFHFIMISLQDTCGINIFWLNNII